ncbi:MAG: response regulator, partial [Nitrosopumilus sp.]
MSNEYVTEKKIEELNQSTLSVLENDIDHACKSKTLKILVVDDSKDIREVLSELITIQGHEVVMVSNGRDGLNMIENNAFDLVLLDL